MNRASEAMVLDYVRTANKPELERMTQEIQKRKEELFRRGNTAGNVLTRGMSRQK